MGRSHWGHSEHGLSHPDTPSRVTSEEGAAEPLSSETLEKVCPLEK